MRVLGVDPASGKKGSACFGPSGNDDEADGALGVDLGVGPVKLAKRLGKFHGLVTWDAPLTGPADPESSELNEHDLTMREIESVWMKFTGWDGKRKKKRVPGVSVLPYSGLSHWVVTRRILGLPLVGEFDKTPSRELIFERPKKPGRYVVETHPTLALWIWQRRRFKDYKSKKVKAEMRRRRAHGLWTALLNQLNVGELYPAALATSSRSLRSMTDDELDARVGWLLGRLWLDGKAGVEMVGNERTGGFLLPVEGLKAEELKALRARGVAV
ncbi:MAG: DUF429 domain-containing protein [Deltaproteobacteria bacterium]|nr:DUF429 domain-containing protein [Deltaproteobacteria bacterium]